MTTNVLITGGFGYLGARMASHLLRLPEHHVCLGGRTLPSPIPAELEGATALRMDVLDDADVRKACEGMTHVIHLAALNEIDSAKNPEQAVAVNIQGTLRMLRAARSAGVRRFIFLSTAHVYGAPLAGTITETTPCRPIHPYAITHRAAEDFVLAAHKAGEIEGIVIRLSNGIGAPLHVGVNRWTLIGNDLCRQAVEKGELVLNSPGLQRRDFITLQDVSRAMEHVMAMPASKISDAIFNLGGECVLQMIDIAELVADRCSAVLGFRPPIRRPQPAPGELAPQLEYRIDALKATGFRLAGGLAEEIDRTLVLCRD